MLNIPLNAVVVGAGKVGSRFDEDSKRKQPWSHSGAYASLPERYRLAGIIEPFDENAVAARHRFPGVPIWDDVETEPSSPCDVVSICTPAEQHRVCVEAVLKWPNRPRTLWCEKPLADSLDDAKRIVEICEEAGVTLFVSHVRRWLPLWRRAREIVESGRLGHTICIRIAMPNRVWSISSHAVDLCLMFGGTPTRTVSMQHDTLFEDGEPAASILIGFETGSYGIVQTTGMRQELIVEAEIIGSEGRMRVSETEKSIRIQEFVDSANYEGYRELGAEDSAEAETAAEFSPFVAIAEEISGLIDSKDSVPTCSGREAYEVVRILTSAVAEAR